MLAHARSAVFVAPERSVSTSRQFLVYGADVRLRGAICEIAERTKQEVLQLLRQPDEWTTPIVVDAQYPQANLPERPRAALSFAQTGFRSETAINPDRRARGNDTGRSPGTSSCCAPRPDLSARKQTFRLRLPTSRLRIGWWRESRGSQLNSTRKSWRPIWPGRSLLEKSFRSPSSWSSGPIRSDHTGDSLYRAYSWVLVKMLTEVSGGRECLARFMADLPRGGHDRMADLVRHFPELISARRRRKTVDSKHRAARRRAARFIAQRPKNRGETGQSAGGSRFRVRVRWKNQRWRTYDAASPWPREGRVGPMRPGAGDSGGPREFDLSTGDF